MERTETSSLDEALRIRLEGGAEVLEAAVTQLHRLEGRLGAGLAALDREDLGELKAALAALPAVDEALEKADRLDGARALAADVRRARDALVPRIAAALASLGHPAPEGGFAAQLRALIAALKYLGRRPGPGERALFEGQGVTGRWPIVAVELLALAGVLAGYAAVAAPLGVAALVVYLAMRKPPARWRLMPDRVQLERPGAPLLEVQYEDIQSVSRTAGAVELGLGDATLTLPTLRPGALEKLLRSMVQHMGGATATPGASAVLAGSLEDRSVHALVVPQGVWIIERGDERTIIDAVLPGHDGASLEDALRALSHLPAVLLARRLEGLPGTWWPADEARVVETANSSLTRVLERNGQTLRVTFGLSDLRDARVALDSVISGWARSPLLHSPRPSPPLGGESA
ncbi:MAG: hypothetical protein AB1730_01390 [Myxococcota bacterium]